MYLVKYNKKFEKKDKTVEVSPAYCIFSDDKLVAYGLKAILRLLDGFTEEYFETLQNGRYKITCYIEDRG